MADAMLALTVTVSQSSKLTLWDWYGQFYPVSVWTLKSLHQSLKLSSSRKVHLMYVVLVETLPHFHHSENGYTAALDVFLLLLSGNSEFVENCTSERLCQAVQQK